MINDIYYTAIINQEAQELRELAAENRLADEVKQARRQQRAVQRENRLLERAVDGRIDRWGQLLDLFRIGRLRRDRRRVGVSGVHAARPAGDRQTVEHRAEAPSDHC